MPYNLYYDEELYSDQVYKDKDGVFQNEIINPEFDIKKLHNIRGIDLPEKICLYTYDDSEFYTLCNIKRSNNIITLNFWTTFRRVNKLPYKEDDFYNALEKKLNKLEYVEYDLNNDYTDFENHYLTIDFSFDELDFTIEDLLKKSQKKLYEINNIIFKELDSPKWKKEYESDEALFTTEFLIPFFKGKGFEDVRYTHGTDEYGRDIIYSRVDEFEKVKYCGVQVKAGNLSGKVKGDIKEIIEQIDDAFKIPFKNTGSNNELNISSMVVAISGKYTNNAKTKIRHKIDKRLLENITFLDKETFT